MMTGSWGLQVWKLFLPNVPGLPNLYSLCIAGRRSKMEEQNKAVNEMEPCSAKSTQGRDEKQGNTSGKDCP